MVISRTPYRISFFGGGTDYKSYYDNYGGSVLSVTFDKYCYVTVRDYPQFFGYENMLTYSKIERFNNPDELSHPLVREVMKYLNVQNIQIAYDADLPARSGIGSSSAFAVGLLNSIYFLRGKRKDSFSLANEAIYVERNLCCEAGGIQDQIAVSYGGLNRIDFNDKGFELTKLQIQKEQAQNFNEHLMLFFTGFQRISNDIAKDQETRISLNLDILHEMKSFVAEGEKILKGKAELNDFGLLLDHSWKLKRGLSNGVSTLIIDSIYEDAKRAGAIGGKLLGSGGGGFMLLFVEPDKQNNVKKALSKILHVPFRFEYGGAKIIYEGGTNC